MIQKKIEYLKMNDFGRYLTIEKYWIIVKDNGDCDRYWKDNGDCDRSLVNDFER